MQRISDLDIKRRLAFDNPWWGEQGAVDPVYRAMAHRSQFTPFVELVRERGVRRAVVLFGPRRVGKTVMIHQAIQQLIDHGRSPTTILYASLDTPVYLGLSLEQLLEAFRDAQGHTRSAELFIFFDEIQYLRDWEIHLKSLVDSYPSMRFVASGSAAAALRLKSRESGAGRFTEFILAPLTFAEYLKLQDMESSLVRAVENPYGWAPYYEAIDIDRLNEAFVDYVNFGGYPEVVLSETVKRDWRRYIRSDIIDKVLLRDLPSLYGIGDIQELNSLMAMLAYNTSSELSYDELSMNSGVAKNTLRRYLEYLEAAFLVHRVRRVDQHARRFRRQTAFKVYLTNPSMRAALFEPVGPEDAAMGALAETAVLGQWMDAVISGANIHYARWQGGEVDLVHLSQDLRQVLGIGEIKWSDRFFANPGELRGLIAFARHQNFAEHCLVTTRSKSGRAEVQGVKIAFEPCAVYAYRVGLHATELRRLRDHSLLAAG